MTSFGAALSFAAIEAEAAQVLTSAGFQTVKPAYTSGWEATSARVYEDAYSVVCVAIYDTWQQLSDGWTGDQAVLVDLISKYFTRHEPKAWDGYLALFTPSVVPYQERRIAVDIQRNTVHVRKLFADGSELSSTSAVRRTLLPVLPLDEHEALEGRNVLESLPQLLAQYGVSEVATQVAIEAFQDQRPIAETIHDRLTKKQGNQT